MGKKKRIFFRGQPFAGYEALIASWNADKPAFLRANARNVATNIRNWRKRNPARELNDEIIERVLTTRAVRNAIMYRGKHFKGPANLFRALGDLPKVSYKAFHLKLSNWRASNPNLSPSDTDIEQFASQIRNLTVDGRWVGPERAVWETLARPKVSWSMFTKRLIEFRLERGRTPTTEEIAELSLPQREWMERHGNPEYTTNDGRQLRMEEFFALFNFEKVSLGTWRHRVNSFKSRTGRKPKPDEAIELMRPWGVVDRAVGILYRWTNSVDGKVYIGITTETFEERVRGHKRTAESDILNPSGLHAAIQHYGIGAFRIEELGRFEAIEDHNSISPNGYNLTSGGKGIAIHALPLCFRGKRYKNLAALATDYGLPVKRLESRLRLGWSLDEAVNIPRGMQRAKPYHSVATKPIGELARERGLNPGNVYSRIKDCRWTIEEALGIVARPRVGGRAKCIVVDGQEFPSNARAAKHFGINEGTWRKRLELGWTLNQAAGIEPPPAKLKAK